MPLMKKEDFANGDESSQFCSHCVNEDGSVKSCDEIFSAGVKFFMGVAQLDKELAERITRKDMSELPHWQDKNCEILEGEKATDEEFQEVLKKLETQG